MAVTVGVLGIQGAVSEHVDALQAAAAQQGMAVEVVVVRNPADLGLVEGLILPGGESTTISRLLLSTGMHDILRQRGGSGDLAIFGTCAGMILLASTATHDVENKGVRLLELLDAEVDRNAFGRQRESHQAMVEVEGLGIMPAVFIRAPVLTRVWGDTRAIAANEHGILAAQKGRIIATAFHPELSGDLRLHEYFLKLVVGKES